MPALSFSAASQAARSPRSGADSLSPISAISAFRLFSWQLCWPRLMASSVVVTLPVLLVFLLLQRYFVRGISLTGIKG